MSVAGDILLDLKKNFYNDRQDIQDRIVEIQAQIAQNKDYIESLSKKDNSDYSMFSPRSATTIYKEQVYAKQLEIEELEEKLRECYRKLANITKKIDSLNSINVEELKEIKEEETPSIDNSLYLKLQEDDRRRIAADLHDSVLQNLSLVMHNIELAEKFIDTDPVRAKLEMSTNRKLVKETIEDIRQTIYNLRPMQFDDFGFKKAMENLIDSYRGHTDMDISRNIDPLEGTDSIVLLTVYRIVQELFINALKHSQGTKIDLLVAEESDRIFIEVSDDGVGMPRDMSDTEKHFGLNIVKERVNSLNGTLKFPSSGKGCKAVVEIPLKRVTE